MIVSEERVHAVPTPASPGYRTVVLDLPTVEYGVEKTRGASHSAKAAPPPEQLVLTGDGRHAVIASGSVIQVFDVGDCAEEAHHIARLELKHPVRILTARPDSAVLAALSDGSVVEVHLAEAHRAKVTTLVKSLGGEPRALLSLRGSVVAVVAESCGRHVLVSVAAGQQRRAALPFANITTITAVDPQRSDRLAVLDARHGMQIVGFATASDAETLEIVPLDSDTRATAIAALDTQWLAVARKGGEVVLMDAAISTGRAAQASADPCRTLRAILARCGCRCHETPAPDPKCPCCDHGGGRPGGHDPGYPGTDDGGGRPGGGQPGGGQPGGGQPGGGQPGSGPNGGGTWPQDDEPCGERKRALLSWSVSRLFRAGQHLVALGAGNRRMAILDRDLNVLFERYLGTRGAHVAAASADGDRLLTLARAGVASRRSHLEIWALDAYTHARGALDLPTLGGRRRIDPEIAKPVVFRGSKVHRAAPNPHLKVCVFTVTEPGQPFTDPDQAKMQAQLLPNVYDVCVDYYQENSFHTLTPEFSVFGVNIGPTGKPLVLPRSFASYFFDSYKPGGISATMPGSFAPPLAFDGREAMTLHTTPAKGAGRDYVVPFAALWTSRLHAAYPVQINLAGTETLQLQVVDTAGTTHNLNVAFPAQALSHAQGDNEAAFLTTLGTYVTNAIRAAETAAGAPVLVQDVKFRRIRANDDDTQFGRLQGQLRIAGGGAQKGTITPTLPGGPVPAGLTALGLGGGTAWRSGVLGSAADIGIYLSQCVAAASFDVGEGPGLNDPQMQTAVSADLDAPTLTVKAAISFASQWGGAGAQITLTSSSGLAGLGWSTATPVAGSESDANNSNTMRYHQDLANDVFTAAMDRIRAAGAWDHDAVEAQFAEFDALMIGFVGACPAPVPAATRWNSVDAADFARLRMFVRYHQATDLTPPGGEDPVTMGTSLLIGQRFNQFDPGVMSHEIGHGLGLPDLYAAAGFRNDVEYIDDWCQMAGGNSRFNHFCAWSKWFVGWIVDDPGDPSLNRTVEVPMPAPSGVTTTEAWLYPVEYWDAALPGEVEAAVGNALPIGQMMKVALGSDGGVVDLIELRARGTAFSQNLPPTPAIVVTNVLQPNTDVRWAVNGLYRRSVQLLNGAHILRAVNDKFDFAASPEFPVKGTTVQLMELQSVRGGTVPIARVKVERQAAEFIDLFFQDNMPSWRSPDIWVDWPGDNPDPNVARVYPEGTPTDQGETVRFPSSGTEKHYLVVRPHNAGNVRAEDVKVRWFICDPPGAGDHGRWIEKDTQTLPAIEPGTWTTIPFVWNVDSATNAHQCIRAEIIDWTIPTAVDPATGDTLALGSDDVILQNNIAQKNVSDFEAAT